MLELSLNAKTKNQASNRHSFRVLGRLQSCALRVTFRNQAGIKKNVNSNITFFCFYNQKFVLQAWQNFLLQWLD